MEPSDVRYHRILPPTTGARAEFGVIGPAGRLRRDVPRLDGRRVDLMVLPATLIVDGPRAARCPREPVGLDAARATVAAGARFPMRASVTAGRGREPWRPGPESVGAPPAPRYIGARPSLRLSISAARLGPPAPPGARGNGVAG